MTERTLERRLRTLEAPDEGDAALRALEIAAAEFERLDRAPARRRRPMRRGLVLVAAALCVAAVAISPAGAKVVRWVGDRFSSPGVKHARPALVSLPAPGRLLVSSRDGTWIVNRDGSKRLLGPYRDAVWSPHGLFVAGVRDHSLVAVDPRGRLHWTVTRSPRPRLPSWSPGNGFRVAYLSGASLRVVAGDGTGDRPLAKRVQPVAPAWRPGAGYVLSYVVGRGHVRTVDAETRRSLWRSTALPYPPFALQWSSDGSQLLAVGTRSLALLDRTTGAVRKRLLPGSGMHFLDARLSPDGRNVALARYDDSAGRSDVVLLSAHARRWHVRHVFEGAGRFGAVRWSPDGRWLLLTWRDADQWLFLRSAAVRGLVAVRGIGRTFEPDRRGPARFPSAGGWCCAP